MKFKGLDKLKKANLKRENAKKKDAEKSLQKSLKEAFKTLKHELPDLEYIQWSQYTPYFNDGEPCVFEVFSFSVKTKNQETLEFPWSFKGTKKQDEALRYFEESLSDLSSYLEIVFGEATLKLFEDRIEAETCDHD